MPNRILIIDDDPDALELLSLLLQRTGYETVTASDGESGLLVAREEKPDLILLDIVLPEMDGFQVLESLRDSPETQEIPVILISGKARSDEKIKARRTEAEVYLDRPFHPHELFSHINDVLE